MTTRSKVSSSGLVSLRLVGFAGSLILCGLAGTAQGQDLTYGRPVSYDSGYAGGYGGPLIHGTYVGAPLTRFPRPSELVPSAWGYGTYGIPTVAGIRGAPVGTPTVYVIDAPPSALRAAAAGRSRILTRSRQGRWSGAPERSPARNEAFRAAPPSAETSGGARVVPVRVSHR
ncbi:hypothetical protein ACLBWX_08765 [Methylobacterium sp. M6A4_1b]